MLIGYVAISERIVSMFALFFYGLSNPHPKIVLAVRN